MELPGGARNAKAMELRHEDRGAKRDCGCENANAPRIGILLIMEIDARNKQFAARTMNGLQPRADLETKWVASRKEVERKGRH